MCKNSTSHWPVSVCLSVSHTHVLSIKWLKILSNIFLYIVAHHFNFCILLALHNSEGDHLIGGLNTCNFQLKLPFILEIIQDRPTFATEWQKFIGSQSIHVGSADLEWPWKAGHDGSNFEDNLHNYGHTVWSRTNKFGRLTHIGEEDISRGQSGPPLQEGRTQSPKKILGLPLHTSICRKGEVCAIFAVGRSVWVVCLPDTSYNILIKLLTYLHY